MTFFRILVAIDALAAAILVFFFVEGLRDGSVSSYNGLLWLGLLAFPALVIGGGFLLRGKGRIGFANALLMLLAVPTLLYGGFVLLVLVLAPDFR